MLLLLTASTFAATPALSLGFTQGAGVGYTDSISAGTTGSVEATLPFHPVLGLSARMATNLSLYPGGDPTLTLKIRPHIGLRLGRGTGPYATAWVSGQFDDVPGEVADESPMEAVQGTLSVGYLFQPGENLQWGPELQVGTEGAYLCLTWRWGTAEVKFHDGYEG